jgi:hypothetical protein
MKRNLIEKLIKFWREVAVATISGLLITLAVWLVAEVKVFKKEWEVVNSFPQKDSIEHASIYLVIDTLKARNKEQDNFNYRVDTTLVNIGGVIDMQQRTLLEIKVWQLSH